MTDIQKPSTEQKLAQLTENVAEYFSIIHSPRSLTDAFNAVSAEKFTDGYWELVQDLRSDLDIKTELGWGDEVVLDIVAAAESKGLDVKQLKTLAATFQATNDLIREAKLNLKGNMDDPAFKDAHMKSLEITRNYLRKAPKA